MVHPRLGHVRDARSRDARSCCGVGVEGRGLVGSVGPVDGYGILRRDLLVQRLRLDSNDAFEKRYGSVMPPIYRHDSSGATYH